MADHRPGIRNLITDVTGLSVGNARDDSMKSGTTVLLCDEPCVASVQVLGGAPGTRETDLLEPHNTVQTVDAIVLSGGSAFGLDAASGVTDWLRSQGRGFQVGPHRVPIVPSAILFDLINGGEKDWGERSPYAALGIKAAENAAHDFEIGSEGAGTGALTANLKGGLGSASTVLQDHSMTIGALVAVNPLGSVTVGDTSHFWAAPFEIGDEFGGLGLPHPLPPNATDLRIKFRQSNGAAFQDRANTTIGIIATDAALTKAQAKRLAIAAHGGFARAIWPSHTPHDGDCIFALSTGKVPVDDASGIFIDLCAHAASTMARAVARGVHAARSSENDILPVWSSR